MKKSLLLSLFTLGVIGASAQITITTSDVAVPPKAIYQSTDSVSSITAGSAGANQTWNMALVTSYVDTLSFIPYSWAPNTDFSTSNLVLQQGTQDIHSYLLNNSGSLSILGTKAAVNFAGNNIMLTQKNSPAEKLATFPYTYNSGFTNDYMVNTPAFATGAAISGIDSARMRSTVHKVAVVDAWGTLTTPLGTYNVIRSKEFKVTHDTTDAYVSVGFWYPSIQTTADSSATYTFWANSVGFPLVTVNMDSVGGVKDIQWLQAQPLALGINEATAPVQVNVYPNPAQNEINIAIDASTVSAVQIFDVMGRIVGSFPISMSVTNVNTSGYANGSYTFSVIGKDKSVLSRGKFTIAK